MTFRNFTAAAVAAFFMAAVGGAQATIEPQHIIRHGSRITVSITAHRIGDLRSQVWDCQRAAELPLSKAAQGLRELASASGSYRAWVAGKWQARLGACERIRAHTLPLTDDWQTAVRLVQHVYPGSEWWLLQCSASEGGHGPWKFRSDVGALTPARRLHPPDVPGGPGQYFQSTFWTDFNAAVQDLRSRSVRVPPSAFSWFSQLGQAVAMGWAYSHARPTGKWTGSGC